tara:strand:+ start:435 stop:860 length:426 start_codon:yes stop_codon:yes gene_type:complete
MIKYQLTCKKCSNVFDSWFSSSKEFEKLKKLRLVNCSKCNSLKIEKSIMAPRISSGVTYSKDTSPSKMLEVKKKLKEFQTYVKNNFDYVGENFTYEARAIHYGNKKSKKKIYGKASPQDIKELNEEGIETTTIPWVSEKDN